MAKPFDIDSLLVILRNILRQRDLLRVRYRESGCLFSPKEDATSNADEQFMCKLNTLLRENLSNPDLNVPFIASAMARVERRFIASSVICRMSRLVIM